MISHLAIDALKKIEADELPAALAALQERIGPTRLREGAEQAITAAGERPDWDTIIPLGEYNLPTFPVETLPDWMREMCEHLSIAMQTPVDLAAMLMLAAVATCCQHRAKVFSKEDWSQPLNLYLTVVLGPAHRKSPVCDAVCKPILDFENGEQSRLAPEVASKKAELSVMEARLKEAQNKAARTESANLREAIEDVKFLARDLAGTPEPGEYRLLAEDSTPEKLADLLAANDGRMAVLSAEGDTFDILTGRYSQSVNLGVYLKSHGGETLIVDRIGRKGTRVNNPALTLGMAIQPDIIEGLMAKPSLRGRGLLGRFLYSLPQGTLGYRDCNPPPSPAEVKRRYADGIRSLLLLESSRDDHGDPAPHVLVFDADARSRFIAWTEEIEVEMRADGEMGDITDWAGKLAGHVMRVAGLLHLCDHALPIASAPPYIRLETVERAITVGRYLIQHAKAAFSEMGADAETHHARYLLAWIERRGEERVTLRDLQQAVKRRFKRIEDMSGPLGLLEQRNYLRVETPTDEERKHNGKGSLRVNPALLSGEYKNRVPVPVVPVVPAIENPKSNQNDTYLLVNSDAKRAADSGNNGDNGNNGNNDAAAESPSKSPFDRGVEL